MFGVLPFGLMLRPTDWTKTSVDAMSKYKVYRQNRKEATQFVGQFIYLCKLSKLVGRLLKVVTVDYYCPLVGQTSPIFVMDARKPFPIYLQSF